MFGAVKLTKNAETDKYKYSGCGIEFNSQSAFSLPDGSIRKNVIISGADMSSSVFTDNRKKDILTLAEGPIQRIDYAALTAEAKYSINFAESNRKFRLSLYYNGSKSFLFVNATKISQFKAKDSEMKKYPLCLGNVSKDFTAINMKKAGLNGYFYKFFVDYNIIDTSNIVDVHKYLMKKHDII